MKYKLPSSGLNECLRLAAFMLLNGISQVRMSVVMDCSEATVHRYVHCLRDIRPEHKLGFLKCYGIEIYKAVFDPPDRDASVELWELYYQEEEQ